MRKIKLCTTTQKTIYEGLHSSLQDAIETAIKENIPLDEIDLSYCKLHHINLDGVSLKGASFKEADLTGANMSEAQFTDCDFSGANMTDACLCYSDIKGCNFKYTRLAAADISMAELNSCAFEGAGLTNLNFHRAHKLASLTYIHGQKSYIFSAPPAHFHSGCTFAILLDSEVICGTNTYTLVCEPANSPSEQPQNREQS